MITHHQNLWGNLYKYKTQRIGLKVERGRKTRAPNPKGSAQSSQGTNPQTVSQRAPFFLHVNRVSPSQHSISHQSSLPIVWVPSRQDLNIKMGGQQGECCCWELVHCSRGFQLSTRHGRVKSINERLPCSAGTYFSRVPHCPKCHLWWWNRRSNLCSSFQESI